MKVNDTDIRGFFGKYSPLSNFHYTHHPIIWNGIEFPTLEHAYQAAKSLDPHVWMLMAQLKTPGQAKRFGQKIDKRADWKSVKVQVMYDLLLQKFDQDDLAQLLESTGNRNLEETNTWGDTFWGVCNGVGKNMLGLLLMQVRAYNRLIRKGYYVRGINDTFGILDIFEENNAEL